MGALPAHGGYAGYGDEFWLEPKGADLAFDPIRANLLYRPEDPGAEGFLSFLNAWVELTAVMNELSRGMGQHDFYPFALPKPAVAKLQFIHMLVKGTDGPLFELTSLK